MLKMKNPTHQNMTGWRYERVQQHYDSLRREYVELGRRVVHSLELSVLRADDGALTPWLHDLPEQALCLERLGREIDRCISELNRRDKRSGRGAA